MRKIKTPTMGEILKEEFMDPYNLSCYRIAKEINVPVSRIQDIVHDRRRMTADTSIRLAKLFGLSDNYFLNIQSDIDIRNTKIEIEKELKGIQILNK